MTFHPDDKILDMIKKAKEELEQDKEVVENAREQMEGSLAQIKELASQHEQARVILDVLDGFVKMMYQIGKNRVDIQENNLLMLQLHESQKQEIDDIYGRLAGLDKER
jgi:hypothetical protein